MFLDSEPFRSCHDCFCGASFGGDGWSCGFLNAKLNIPVGRMSAANWVYQFAVAATVVGILRVPYDATIIAHERMSFYAWNGHY